MWLLYSHVWLQSLYDNQTNREKPEEFKKRVLRKICVPIIVVTTRNWRRRYNKELYNMLELAPVTFIKGQRIQWIGHIMRRGENEAARVALEWRPQGKIHRGRPRKRWIDMVEENLKTLGVEDWREAVQDRDGWRSVVMVVKTFREYSYQRKKKKNFCIIILCFML